MTDWLEELLALAGAWEERGEPFPLPIPAGMAPLTAPGRENPGQGAGTAAAGIDPAFPTPGPEEPEGEDLVWLFQGGSETGPVGGAALETGRTARETFSGLEGLYRRVTEGALVPAPVPAAIAGQGAIREEAPAAGLTAEELDRAVRRDSRRYDGAMSIY